ncbi:MAG: hypothetical protein WA878_16275, partial [Pseudomonas sp.]
EQLTCLLFSPFVDGGKGLAGYLVRCHPECVAALAPLHQVLQGSRNDEPMTRWLVTVSGLPIQALRRLYSQRGASGPGPQTLIARLRAGDPDGARVQLLDPVTGQTTTERVCGR